ncbi:MAG: hypothetical protein C4335_11750 [Armatimonadota bacterium]
MKMCVEWWTALSAYVDDSLPPDARERVEKHLEECESCRRALVDLQVLRHRVGLLPCYEPPPMLKARILSATVDQPTWSERLAMEWRRWVWRFSLAGAAVALVLFAWQFMPRHLPSAVDGFVSGGAKKRSPTVAQQVKTAPPRRPTTVAAVRNKPLMEAKRREVRDSAPAPKSTSPKPESRWSVVTRTPIAPKPAPADALQGEPVIQDDVPYIDTSSPPAGEQVATQPDEAESKTVATRFALPAETLSQGTSGLDALREQIRIRNQEQWSGEIKRKLQRKQVDVDVITVRF